jgi:hypothetical protein
MPFPDDVVPPGMDRGIWGKMVWGRGPGGARALIGARTADQLRELGLTVETAARLRAFYVSAARAGRGGETALERIKLLDDIIKTLKG